MGTTYYLMVPPLSLGANTIMELEPTTETYTTCLPPSNTGIASWLLLHYTLSGRNDTTLLPFTFSVYKPPTHLEIELTLLLLINYC